MEPLGLKIKKALSRLKQTDNYLFRKPEREWDYDDLSLVKSFLRTARVEEDYTMEDLNKIQEFFSKPLEEMMSLDDQAKAYYLEKFKKGEISSLPEDPKAAFLNQMMKDEMEKDAAQYRRETGLEEVSAEYSRRNKRPIKVGDIVGNTVQGFDFKVLDIQDDLMKVKNFITGKEFMTDIDNMQLLYPDESIKEGGKWGYQEAAKNMIKFLQNQLDDMGIEYEMDPKSLSKPFIIIYKPENQSEELNAKFENFIEKANLKSVVKEKGLDEGINDFSPITYAKKVLNGEMSIEDAMEETGLRYVTLADLIKKLKLNPALEEAITDPRIGNPKFGPAPKQFADLRAKLGDESLLDKIQMINVNTLRELLDELDSYNIEESTYNEYSQVGYKKVKEAEIEDKIDTITMDVPLFLRMLEYSREDASQDMDLHDVTEKAVEINKGKEYLSMEDYSEIVQSAEEIDEAKGGELDERYFLEVSVRDARKALDIFRDQYRDFPIKLYGSNVYASNNLDGIYDFYYDLMAQDIEVIDSSDFDEDDFEDQDYEETDYMKRRSGDYSEDEFEQSDYMRRRMDEVTKGFGDRISAETFSKLKGKKIGYFGNTYKVIDSDEFIITLEDEDGDIKTVNLNQFIQKGIIPELKKKIQETINLGEGMIYEELCPAGKAYIKRRKAAGEKSSAYLSGRAVKVCKGQMSGRAKKK